MKILIISSILFLLTSCATFTLSNESLITQLQQNQKVYEIKNLSSLGVNYPSNGLEKIECINSKNQKVSLYPSKNVSFQIVKKSSNQKITIYFDTMILQNDTLFGLKSRILGGLQKIPVDDVASVSISAENPKTEYVQP